MLLLITTFVYFQRHGMFTCTYTSIHNKLCRYAVMSTCEGKTKKKTREKILLISNEIQIEQQELKTFGQFFYSNIRGIEDINV